MIANESEIEKINLNLLSVEFRKQLLEAIQRDVVEKYPDDPEAQRMAMIALENIKASFN